MAGEEKPKIFEGSKDIVMSLAVVMVMMLVAVGATGLCSVNPEESKYARTNAVDASTFLDLESRSGGMVLRDPHMPEGWVANSARRSSIAGQRADVVGWVTADDGFVQAYQTQVSLADAMKGFDGSYRPNHRTVEVDGTPVEIYSSDDRGVRDLWGIDLHDARLILTGSSKDADFEETVRAFVNTAPLNPSGQN